jgi:hypothetical protein
MQQAFAQVRQCSEVWGGATELGLTRPKTEYVFHGDGIVA